jgi:hypothetical protein
MIAAKKERHGTVEVADAYLGRAGVEIEGAFLVDLGLGIGRREDLDADLPSAREDEGLSSKFRPGRIKPGNAECFNTVSGRNGAFRQGLAVGDQLVQQTYNGVLAARMAKARWRSHEDVAVSIGLDPVWELSEPWV